MAAPLEHNRDGGYKASAEQMRIQQAAAAAAAEAFTPEAIAAEAARREKALAEEAAQWRKEGREQCIREGRPIEEQYLEPSPAQPVDEVPAQLDEVPAPVTGLTARKSRLADALAPVVEEHQEPEVEEEVPADVMGGAHLVRWILVPAEESDGWTLGLSTESHEDEVPDAVYLEVTQAMMRKWRNAPASAHDLERFAAGLMEKVADALAEDLTDRLIESLQRITTGELREKQYLGRPTETAIGPDDDAAEIQGDFALESGEPVEPFESLEAYVAFRDDYAQTASREDFAAFLDDNQEYEDEIERRASEGS